MATFDPDPELFRRQIASIVAQTHERWICLLSDDASPPEALGAVERELGGDPRFVLHRAGHRAGFYGNFERALRMVPAGVELVALADQDDHWYPDKLQALIEALGDGASLAYSDMRIVDRDGQRLADTYWGYRRNNYTDLGSLLIANTVTGAASLFSASLLDRVLPFPPKHSNLFHDHWIAQVAICAGEVAYVDRPLYDYVQHGEAAIGHRAANAGGRYQVPLASRLRAGWQQLRSHRFRPAWRAPYFNVYCRVALCMVVLRLRCGPTMSPERLAELERVGAGRPGLSWLLRRSLRDLGGVTETIGRERVMLAGLAWRGSAELRKRLRAARQRRSLPESRP
jgi:glycosyltransferase involved in cell wall biosynthesis